MNVAVESVMVCGRGDFGNGIRLGVYHSPNKISERTGLSDILVELGGIEPPSGQLSPILSPSEVLLDLRGCRVKQNEIPADGPAANSLAEDR